MILSESLLRFWERSGHPLFDVLSRRHWVANEESGEISLSELSSMVSNDRRVCNSESLSKSYKEVAIARNFADDMHEELGIKTEWASKARRGEVSPSDPRVTTLTSYFRELIN